VDLVGFVIRIYHDARSPECQTVGKFITICFSFIAICPFCAQQYLNVLAAQDCTYISVYGQLSLLYVY